MLLAGDIGGTKTILALYSEDKQDFAPFAKETYKSKEFHSLEQVLEKFLLDRKEKITKACFGVAGPVIEGLSKTPNLPWIIGEESLKKCLKTQKVHLINDLLANAYGIKTLSSHDFFVLNKGEEDERGNQGLISAGTGLGEAGIISIEGERVPFASEGGHCSFSPKNDLDLEFLYYLRKKYSGHVSIERVLSGQGLENIYSFLIEEKQMAPLQTLENAKSLPAAISEAAKLKENEAAMMTLDLFVRHYGAEAGDVALKFLATGGIFLGGGIAPKILPFLQKTSFLESFCDKGRLQGVLEKIPIKVILNHETALRGAGFFVKNL